MIAPRSAHDLIFIDEAGVNLAMARHYARSPQGTRAYAMKPCNKGHNVTLLGALALDGVVATMMIEGGTNADVFITYLQECLLPHLRPGHVVIMDNLKAHKTDDVQTLLASVGAQVEYLPPYSPDFAPIEECWSKVKASLRTQAARTYDALHRAIAHAFNVITAEDAQGWFAHCGYVAH
jgi:transposase